MSAVYPAQEKNIRGITNGKAIVEHKSHEMPVRLAGLVEVSQKKGNKQAEREKAKVESYNPDMMENTNTIIGASPADDLSSSISYENPRAMWTPKERKQMRDFERLREKYLSAYIPVEIEDLKWKLLNRFGTIHHDQMVRNLNIQMQKDPRLTLLTKKGPRKTSVDGQREFSAEIAARFVPKKSHGKT